MKPLNTTALRESLAENEAAQRREVSRHERRMRILWRNESRIKAKLGCAAIEAAKRAPLTSVGPSGIGGEYQRERND